MDRNHIESPYEPIDAHMDVSRNRGSPIAGWLGKILSNWMMKWGTPMTQETSSNKPFIKQGVDPVRWLGWAETDIDVTVRIC